MPKLNLTQGFVRKSEIQKGLASVDYYDERMPGLLLKVLSSGRKTYYIRYKNLKKVSWQRKIGNAVILKLSEARALARRKLAEVAMGATPSRTNRKFSPLRSRHSPQTTTSPM